MFLDGILFWGTSNYPLKWNQKDWLQTDLSWGTTKDTKAFVQKKRRNKRELGRGSAWCYVLGQNSCRSHWLRLAIQWCFQGPILSNTTNFERPLLLVGGFNPVEKYSSKWIISPGKGENKKIFETTTQFSSFTSPACWHTSEQSSTCQVRSPASKLSRVRLVIWPKTGFVLCIYISLSKHHKKQIQNTEYYTIISSH